MFIKCIIVYSLLALSICDKKLLSDYKKDIDLHIPANLTFCGEQVPLNKRDVLENLEHEIIINKYAYSATILIIKRFNRYKDEFYKILKEEGVPEDFIFLMVAESGVKNATSPSNAQGFWQFLEGTAKEFDLVVNSYIDQRNDPYKSARSACQYIKAAYKKLNNWTLAAAAYNMGLGGIQAAIQKQKESSYYDLYLNQETARYVYRILAFKLILSNPQAYGYKLHSSELYPVIPTRTVQVYEAIPSLVDFAKSNGTTYKMVRILNPWIRQDSLPAPTNGFYQILLPLDH